MARFLFWNINKKPIAELIATICHQREIDVLILAESTIPAEKMILALNVNQFQKFVLPLNPSDRLSFFIRYPRNAMSIIYDDNHLALRALQSPLAPEILIAAVHLPSKLWKESADQAQFATRIGTIIRETEQERGHSRTIVVGDFNMSPFEHGIVSSETFHGVMDRRIAREGGRKVDGVFRRFFYNPMWSKMGDCSDGPSGTHYYREGSAIAYFWHTLDQVLIRPDLLDKLPENGVEVLTSVGQNMLINKESGRPDSRIASDHLPLYFELMIEELAQDGVY